MAAAPSEELRTVLQMFVILITANFKFRNRSTWSKGPIKRAGKVSGDSQGLKSHGTCQLTVFFAYEWKIVDQIKRPNDLP